MALYPGKVLADNPAAYYGFNEPPGSSAYVDATAHERDIPFSSEGAETSVGIGVATWTYYSRYTTTGISIPYTATSVSEYTAEFFFKAESDDTYVFLDVGSSTTDLEFHGEVSEDPSNPGDYLVKFGAGYGAWDINLADTHAHSFVYSQAVNQILDGTWHHIVCVWEGTVGVALDDTQFTIYVDGEDATDAATGDTNLSLIGLAPYNMGGPVFITGPFGSDNATPAYYDEFAVYELALSSADVVDHYNAAATIEPAYEIETATELLPWTDGFIMPAYEQDQTFSFSRVAPTIAIEATTAVTAAYTTNDSLLGRTELDPSGSTAVDVSTATLESGEPNAAGYSRTLWFELPLSPEEILQERILLESPTSTGKVSVYKQPSLDDADDTEEADSEELPFIDPLDGEPSFSEMVLVQTAAADQRFDLDTEYGSSYFLQVGLLSGTGDDFTLTWGDASPGEGGEFDGAVEATGTVGLQTLNTANAWIEAGEPNSTGIVETRSVWLKWTSPSSVTASTTFTIGGGSGEPFAAEVYTGAAINALSQQTSGLSTDGTNLLLTITATPDTDYYVRIATTVDNTNFVILWGGPRLEYPANDPAQHLMVTVHAGVAGATLAGKTYVANEQITELPNRKGLQFQESLNVTGSGSITVQQDDKILRAFNPDDWPFETSGTWSGTSQETWRHDPFQLLAFGNIVKFWMNKKVSEGVYQLVCVHGFIIKAREANVIGSGEATERTITVSGPSVLALLNDFIVVHDNYPRTRKSEMRAFNWASVAGPSDLFTNGGWFDSGGNFNSNKSSWNHPINANGVKNPPGYKKRKSELAVNRPKYALTRARKPKWPDMRAKWLWMSQQKDNNQNTNFPPKRVKIRGLHYYRTKNLNITKGGMRLRASAHSDTYYEIYIDGELFMSGNGNENYTKFKRKKTVLDRSGNGVHHTIAVYVEDRKTEGKNKGKDFDHNDAFIFTLQLLNKKGKVKRTLIDSNASQWYAWHGENPPAWSRASILRQVILEARERGVQSAQAISIASDFGQKSAEGNFWWDLKKVSMELQVGMSALDIAGQFSESQRFDLWMDPNTLQLFAYQGGNNGAVPRGRDASDNVALVPGYNLLNYTVQETDEVRNFLLVQYSRGFLYAAADTYTANYESMARYGRREGYLEIGDYISAESARAKGKEVLSQTADAEATGGSSDIVGHFGEDYNGSVIAVPGAVPFLDWDIGDTISAPAANGVLHPHRVLSLSCTEDDNGNLTFDPEIQGY